MRIVALVLLAVVAITAAGVALNWVEAVLLHIDRWWQGWSVALLQLTAWPIAWSRILRA